MQQKAGVFIDIDGVVLHGGKPFEWSKQAIHELWNNKIPFVFVTNGTYSSAKLVENLTDILELPFNINHVIVAPSPCRMLTQYHQKRVLVCGQEDSIDLVDELGFSDYLTIADLTQIFPQLDFVDHNKRLELLKRKETIETQNEINNFRPIEAILLLGEPINWECSLQVLIDILMTNGDPRTTFKFVPSPHLPIIVCNKDLTFKGAAALPRFGHGAFLECLESLYMKITRNELVYTHLMGKPYLVTYEFAANQIQKLNISGDYQIQKFYIIGDNPDVDIKGANLFKEHLYDIDKLKIKSTQKSNTTIESKVESILVCTGVYNPQNDLNFHLEKLFSETNQEASKESLNINDLTVTSTADFYLNSSRSSSEANLNSSRSQIGSVANFSNVIGIEKTELKKAISRHNSFISYFENKQNIPDVTLNNLQDAVNYILNKELE